MRIALNGYFWDQPRTGSGQYIRRLWSALSELVAQLPDKDAHSLMLMLPGHDTLCTGAIPLESKTQSLPLSEAKGPKSKIQKIVWEQRGAPQQAKLARAQLLHIPYLAAPLLKSVPLAVTAHDMIPWVLPGYGGSLAMRLYLMLAAAGARRARLIIADSEASRRDVIRVLRVSPSKVHAVYLGVEPHPDYTPEQLAEVRTRYGLPDDYAFYLGGFDRRKNVPLLLRAWRAASQALDDTLTLAIGGDVPPPGGVFPDVRGEAARLGFTAAGDVGNAGGEDPVRFLGRVSEEDKPLLMAAARVFVYPSAYEGFGLDPLEAMSAGCPVVSSSGGSLVEVVGDAGLLTTPGDEKALCESIVRVWKDDNLRARLIASGKERASHFSWQRTARQTWDLYGEVMRET